MTSVSERESWFSAPHNSFWADAVIPNREDWALWTRTVVIALPGTSRVPAWHARTGGWQRHRQLSRSRPFTPLLLPIVSYSFTYLCSPFLEIFFLSPQPFSKPATHFPLVYPVKASCCLYPLLCLHTALGKQAQQHSRKGVCCVCICQRSIPSRHNPLDLLHTATVMHKFYVCACMCFKHLHIVWVSVSWGVQSVKERSQPADSPL